MGKDTLELQIRLLANYDQSLDKNGVSGKRLAERLDALSRIGRTAENGSNRPGFSHEEKAAKELDFMNAARLRDEIKVLQNKI